MQVTAYQVPADVRDSLLLPSFERHLRAENKAQGTLDTYSGAVSMFGTFLAEKGMPTNPANIKREHIESFIEHLLSLYKPATANNRYRGLQAYFKWLGDEGEIKPEDNPMLRMKPPTIPPTPPDVLTEQDLAALFKAVSGQSFEDRRDAAMLRLLLDSGIRRGELAGITIDDLDLDAGRVTVTGKGKRTRTVSFGKKTAVALDRYSRMRQQHRHKDSPYFWLGLHGPIRGDGVRQIVEKRAKQAGIKAYAHLFRHTNAHLWLKFEGSEVGLMAHMGWNSRTMLQRYGASKMQERAMEEHKRLGVGDRF